MTASRIGEQPARKPLRLLPGVILAALVVVLRYVVPAIDADFELFGMPLGLMAIFGGMAGTLLIVLWWLFFSRASWTERLLAPILMAAAVFTVWPLVHESIRGGNMGAMLVIYSVPVMALALVAAAMATRRHSTGVRCASIAGAIALAAFSFTLLRTAGTLGAGSELHWRWTPTPEELLLASVRDEPKPLADAAAVAPAPDRTAEPAPSSPAASAPGNASPSSPAAATKPDSPERVDGGSSDPGGSAGDAIVAPEWPGFRGARRDSVVRGVRIKTDWSSSPPVELWRRPIGPGWSSFAVRGDLLYTQEQRGEEEIVGCYRVSTGEPVWRHRDAARFWESNGGPGPRGTPTLHGNRVFAFGATGVLNALDARTGRKLWSRNVAEDAKRRIPDWGFSSSPLIIDDVVIVAASGSLAGYDAASGAPRWTGPSHLTSYSSPHRMTIEGVEQVVLLSGTGAVGVAPADGAMLWEHQWQSGGATITQPALTPDGDVLINSIVATGGLGTRRLHVAKTASGWTVEERWTSTGLKPYFNDFVIHEGHAYGFDGSILSAIDLQDGTRKWKGGRYGNGQMLLLADQDALLVISEEGELVLVNATPDRFTEIARFPVLNAKTWNHPVVVGDVLLVRNGEEMAAFRLPSERVPTE